MSGVVANVFYFLDGLVSPATAEDEAIATALSVIAWLGLVALSAIPFLPRDAASGTLAHALPLAGLLYAALLAVRLDWARRCQARLSGGELARYRLMAEASADMITQ